MRSKKENKEENKEDTFDKNEYAKCIHCKRVTLLYGDEKFASLGFIKPSYNSGIIYTYRLFILLCVE